MSDDRYNFDETVQEDILRLIVRDARFTDVASDWVNPNYFDTVPLKKVGAFALNFYQKFGYAPTLGQFLTEASYLLNSGEWKFPRDEDKDATLKLIERLYDDKAFSRDYTIHVVQRFAQAQEWKSAIMDGVQLLRKGDFDGLNDRMSRASSVVGAKSTEGGGYWYFESREERFKRRSSDDYEDDVIPTGIKELDIWFRNNGVCPGEIGLCLAPTNGGKSIFLLNAARRAVWLRKRVAIYTFEMSKEKNADRLDSSFSGIDMNRLIKDEEAARRAVDKLAKMFPRSLYIHRYPTRGATMLDIKRDLEFLRKRHNWAPHLIVLDYAKLVRPLQNFGDKKNLEIESILEDFRGLCGELTDMGYPTCGWTANQINRGGAKKHLVDETDAQASYDQAGVPDYIITINQGEDEKDENQLRLFLSKNRDGENKVKIGPLYTDWARMCFVLPKGAPLRSKDPKDGFR